MLSTIFASHSNVVVVVVVVVIVVVVVVVVVVAAVVVVVIVLGNIVAYKYSLLNLHIFLNVIQYQMVCSK